MPIENRKSKLENPLPPGPRSRFPGDLFLQLRRDPLAFLTRLTQQHGDITTFTSLGRRYIVLNHPDLAKEVLLTQADAFWKGPALQNSKDLLGEGLLTAEGETHKSQRRLMQPAFHAKHVENYAADVLDCTRNFALPPAGGTLDIRPHMMRLTLLIAGRTLFGTLLEEEAHLVAESMEALMGNYSRTVVPWGKLLNRLPIPSTLRLRKAQLQLRDLVARMIAKRRGEQSWTGTPKNDLLSTLIAATDPEHKGAKLTDIQLRDQAITILTAGHETTANAMTFTLYLLAKHPVEQEKLRKEIAQVLADRDPTLADLDHLKYTRNVLSESMRLLPPAWTIGRQNRRELVLGNHRIPNKCTVLIPQWTLHRDARFFPDPLSFTPDRWKTPTHPRFAYLPFSTGPRNCIGESFAWLEMLLALPMLIQKFHFTLADPSAPFPLTPAITLRPAAPVLLNVAPIPQTTPAPVAVPIL
ncbi:MAG: cytochrome P450 [Phycisphaerae bacterium]